METVYLVLITHDFVVVEVNGKLYEVHTMFTLDPYETAALVLKAPREALKIGRAYESTYSLSDFLDIYRKYPAYGTGIKKFAYKYPELVSKIHPEVRKIVGV